MASPEREQWQAAIDSELQSLAKHNTFRLTRLPDGRRCIGSRWVLRRKYGADGKVARYKARLVAKGCAQVEGVDFSKDEIRAPALHSKSLRVVLCAAASLNYELKQMDVPTAFLNAVCKDDIYMKVPSGYPLQPGINAGMVLKLEKTLYGIKQAPREWNIEYNNAIVALGYTRCSSDTCVYVKRSRTGNPMIIPVFVDDSFPACATADLPELMADLSQLMAKYHITECNDAHVVLGMRVTRDRQNRSLKLDQQMYIEKILHECGMAEAKGAATPELERSRQPERAISSSSSDTRVGGDARQQQKQFRSIIGALLYAALATRADIAHACVSLSRSVNNPQAEHWAKLKHLLRYLSATNEVGLTFGGGASSSDSHALQLSPTFCDADWAGDSTDRRSITGYIMKINGSTVSWASKKQTTVSLSSAEAEYMAAGAATQEIIWLRGLLSELGWPQQSPTILQCDNQAAIAIAAEDIHHARTKHIDIRLHFIRSHVAAGTLRLQWVPTADQQADILTKPLGRIAFARLRDRVLGGSQARE
jgi:hypothetical protein